ncbi:chemotaxis protein CheW [Thiohalorhabdus sp. Cl-TMA]|uniref:Chemotaxis protein CheW n=1 Tax=Thiohalorhabdus methylotrophus TaxID=3242694 RepID=A0ABV4TZH5_9GAMM
MTPPEASVSAVPPEAGQGEGRFTIIGLAGWYFAVPLERSAGSMEAVTLTRAPMAPEAVLGLTHLQGRILTVLDLRHLLGLGRGGPPRRFFLVNDEDEQVGLVVDSVEDIVLVSPLNLDSIQVELPPGVRANASGFFRWRGHPVVNLSVERLLK